MMNDKEKNMAMYGYIIYMFGKLAEEHEMIKENLPELINNRVYTLVVNKLIPCGQAYAHC